MCFYIVLDLPLDFWLCSFLVLGQWLYFPHVWTWTYNWKRLCMGLETFMLFDLGCEFWMCLYLHVVLWLWMWNIWLYVYLYEYVCEFCGQKKEKRFYIFLGTMLIFVGYGQRTEIRVERLIFVGCHRLHLADGNYHPLVVISIGWH